MSIVNPNCFEKTKEAWGIFFSSTNVETKNVCPIAYNSFIYAKTAPPQMISYQINVIPKWLIKNEPNYFVDDKNKVYNLKTGKALQMQLKGYTKGYYLSGCFYSLN